jgi:heme O synthase-like polyprenyltransferase
MAKNKSISRSKKLNSCDPQRSIVSGGVGGAFSIVIGWIQVGGEEKSNIVTRVHLHNLTSTHRPIKVLCFSTWVLNH